MKIHPRNLQIPARRCIDLQGQTIGGRFDLRVPTQEVRRKQMEAAMKAVYEQWPPAQWVDEVRGIGMVTAVSILAYIGPIERFPTSEDLISYAGLAPGHRQPMCARSSVSFKYAQTWMGHGSSTILDLYYTMYDDMAYDAMATIDYTAKKPPVDTSI